MNILTMVLHEILDIRAENMVWATTLVWYPTLLSCTCQGTHKTVSTSASFGHKLSLGLFSAQVVAAHAHEAKVKCLS